MVKKKRTKISHDVTQDMVREILSWRREDQVSYPITWETMEENDRRLVTLIAT